MLISIIILIYLIIAYFAYEKFISDFDNKEWEKILFSIGWPLVLILYGIRKIHESL